VRTWIGLFRGIKGGRNWRTVTQLLAMTRRAH